MPIPHLKQRLVGREASLERVLMLTPHLYDIDHTVSKYNEVLGGDPSKYPSWYFTSPGVKVKGAIHHYCLFKNSDGLELSRAFVRNAQTSAYKVESESCFSWQSENVEGLVNPPAYSPSNFQWCVFYENSVVDPSRRVPDFGGFKQGEDPNPRSVEKGLTGGRPVLVTGVGMAYPRNKDPNTTQNHSDPDALDNDCDLIVHGSDLLLWEEVRGCSANTSGAPKKWCALCGHALGLTGCARCDYLYRDNGFDCGGGPPIGARAQKLVESHGWSFAKDPAIARQEWAAEMEKYRK